MKHILGFLTGFSILLFARPVYLFEPNIFKGVPTYILGSSFSLGDFILVFSAIAYILLFSRNIGLFKNKIITTVGLLLFIVIFFKFQIISIQAVVICARMALFYFLLSDKKIRKSFIAIMLPFLVAIASLQYFLQHSVGLPLEPVMNTAMKGIAKVFAGDLTILRPSSFFQHPNILSGFIVIGLLILLDDLKKLTSFHYSFLVLGILGVLLTGSRSGLIASFFLIFIISIAHSSSSSFRRVITTIILLGIPFIPYFAMRSAHTAMEEPIRYRTDVLIDSFDVSFREILFSGRGIVEVLQPTKVSSEPFYLSQPPHNTFAVFFLAVGFVPGILLLILWWTLSRPISILKLFPLLPLLLFDYYILSPMNIFLFLPLFTLAIKKSVSRETL